MRTLDRWWWSRPGGFIPLKGPTWLLAMHLLLGPPLLGFALYLGAYPPPEINGTYGYRTETSMQSPEAWALAQRISAEVMLVGAIVVIAAQVVSLLILQPIVSIIFSCVVLLLVVTLTLPITEHYLKSHLTTPPTEESRMKQIHIGEEGMDFVLADSGDRFVAWGFNYDHDDAGRLLEDYWVREWPSVVEDFQEMRDLGANAVRIHLQLAGFMEAPDRPDPGALEQLKRLLELAEATHLYLDITGLGCYHKSDVPEWYDRMEEAERWEVQAGFWEAVASTCASSHAIFCYDLMNEPLLPGENETKSEWLAGEFGGKHFMQYVTRDLTGRTRKQVAKEWVEKLTSAIRLHDQSHLITVGVVPWAYTFPGAKPLFYAPEVCTNLDFVSVHFYPERNKIPQALTALRVYDIGIPLVIEEMSQLYCGIHEFDTFVQKSRPLTDGYFGFFWGTTAKEYRRKKDSIKAAIMAEWLEYFQGREAQ